MTAPSSPSAQTSGAEPDVGAIWPAGDVVQPINWNALTAAEAEPAWLDLNNWVHWLRASYGLPVAVVPPLWHRHDELVWELSALHTAWLNAYDRAGSPYGPLNWHRDFADARHRLRDWTSTCGTKLDRDRPTRISIWPGETARSPAVEVEATDREADFFAFVSEDVGERRRIEERVRGLR